MSNTNKRLVVFGSARPEPDSPEYQTAYEIGKIAATQGYLAVTGGYGGIMAGVAQGAVKNGGKALGVTVREFGPGNDYQTRRDPADSLFERIEKLLNGASVCVILPGGSGTLLELAAVIELGAKGLIDSIPHVLLLGDFWRPTIDNIMPEVTAAASNPVPGRPTSKMVERIKFCADLHELSSHLEQIHSRQSKSTGQLAPDEREF